MSAQVFYAKYQGPKGRHLSCLTRTSLYGTDNKPELNQGIHRSGYGRGYNGKPKETVSKHGKSKVSAWLDIRRRHADPTYMRSIVNDSDGKVRIRIMSNGYRMPGSMNPKS